MFALPRARVCSEIGRAQKILGGILENFIVWRAKRARKNWYFGIFPTHFRIKNGLGVFKFDLQTILLYKIIDQVNSEGGLHLPELSRQRSCD